MDLEVKLSNQFSVGRYSLNNEYKPKNRAKLTKK